MSVRRARGGWKVFGKLREAVVAVRVTSYLRERAGDARGIRELCRYGCSS